MLLEIENLKLAIDGKPILNGVSLHLEKGTIYGLLGPNGAGKTTTIFSMLGLYDACFDKFEILGCSGLTDINKLKVRIGVMPEGNGFYEWMSPAEYLTFFSCLYGIYGNAEGIARLIGLVGLSGAQNKFISQYSKGMRQRLAIAKALINDPELLILDEPTNGLDPRGRKEIHDLLLFLAKEKGIGILLTTHILEDVERLCRRIGIINRGSTVFEKDLTDILVGATEGQSTCKIRLEGLDYEKIRLPHGVEMLKNEGNWCHLSVDRAIYPSLAELWTLCLSRGMKIVEISQIGERLEDLYMKCTSSSETDDIRGDMH